MDIPTEAKRPHPLRDGLAAREYEVDPGLVAREIVAKIRLIKRARLHLQATTAADERPTAQVEARERTGRFRAQAEPDRRPDDLHPAVAA